MTLEQSETQVLCDKKWRKFLKRARKFKFIPFVDLVFGAGSLALGNVTKDSDFDVLVGVRQGRIFSTRFFCLLFFGFFGLARTRLDHGKNACDKICFNHFITENAYALTPPYSESWKDLYINLIPVYGSIEKINYFWETNSSWLCIRKKWNDDLRYIGNNNSWMKNCLEMILYGVIGDVLEFILKYFQIKKIEHSLSITGLGYSPRVLYNDNELEFHPDRKKFEEAKK